MSGHRGDRGGQDRWLMSYADIMTLLLAMFSTMYAASAVDAKKLVSIDESAVLRPGTSVPEVDELEALRRHLSAELEQEIRLKRAELSRDGRGLVLSMPERATFNTGSAEVTADARRLLVRLAEAMQPLPNTVRVEGHTDDVPIHTPQYASNWELSTARAAAVVTLLIDTHEVHPGRLSAAGYAEFHPRTTNDTPENRARNRRIDLVIVDTAKMPQGDRR